MTIDVAPDVRERVQRHLDSGRFADASEVISHALDALDYEDKLRVLIAEADADIALHGTIPWTPTLMDEIMEEARLMDLDAPLPEHLRPK